MKRTSLHSLDPSSARKKIARAKSNKPFVAALLDRDHRGHKDAVEQWTRLHQAAFPEPDSLMAGRSTGRGGEEPVRVLGFAFRGSESSEDVGSETRAGRMAKPFKTRLQSADGKGQGQPSEVGSSDPPIINIEADRIQAILDDAPALFEIRENPDADETYADHRANHNAGVYAVWRHSAIIEREAARQGVDADLVKAIMYVENAQGQYGNFGEWLGVSDTIFPMNISKETWSGLGAKPEEFFDPEINIRVGVTLIRRIQERIDEPTPEKIASIWIFTGRELVNDYGARVQNVYEHQDWKQPVTEEPGPLHGTP